VRANPSWSAKYDILLLNHVHVCKQAIMAIM